MRPDTSPTGRALLALDAIQTNPGISGARLATRLGVTERAARRYVGVLRQAGIPVDSVSGPYGGYRLGRGVRMPPLTFSNAEALGLVMAVLQGWHGSVESEHPAAGALAKIVRALPAATAAPVEAIRRVRAQNPSDAATMPDPDLTAALASACAATRRVRIAYRTGRDLELDAWAVVVRHGRWYLLGRRAGGRHRRVLRLDRITALETLGAAEPPPAGLDPVREVEDHLADGWTHRVEVRIAAPAEAVAWSLPRTLGRLEPDGPDACVLRGSTDEPDRYAAQLAALRVPFTVTGSEAVRTEVAAVGRRLTRAATGPAPAAGSV